MDYIDGDGNTQHQGGGGVALGIFGKERPLSEEELMENINAPDVRYLDDGSIWVYWFDQKIEITDKFEDGICYVKLENEKETLYMTIKHQNGWSASPHKYLAP